MPARLVTLVEPTTPTLSARTWPGHGSVCRALATSSSKSRAAWVDSSAVFVGYLSSTAFLHTEKGTPPTKERTHVRVKELMV